MSLEMLKESAFHESSSQHQSDFPFDDLFVCMCASKYTSEEKTRRVGIRFFLYHFLFEWKAKKSEAEYEKIKNKNLIHKTKCM